MGYRTSWVGRLSVTPSLDVVTFETIKEFLKKDKRDTEWGSKFYGPWSNLALVLEGSEIFIESAEHEKDWWCDTAGWLAVVIHDYIIPAGALVNGELKWYGEENDDVGIIRVKDNEIFITQFELVEGPEKPFKLGDI